MYRTDKRLVSQKCLRTAFELLDWLVQSVLKGQELEPRSLLVDVHISVFNRNFLFRIFYICVHPAKIR